MTDFNDIIGLKYDQYSKNLSKFKTELNNTSKYLNMESLVKYHHVLHSITKDLGVLIYLRKYDNLIKKLKMELESYFSHYKIIGRMFAQIIISQMISTLKMELTVVEEDEGYFNNQFYYSYTIFHSIHIVSEEDHYYRHTADAERFDHRFQINNRQYILDGGSIKMSAELALIKNDLDVYFSAANKTNKQIRLKKVYDNLSGNDAVVIVTSIVAHIHQFMLKLYRAPNNFFEPIKQ